MIIEEEYSPEAEDDVLNGTYYELENCAQMLKDRLCETPAWRILTILKLKRRIRLADREFNDFKWRHKYIFKACILDL